MCGGKAEAEMAVTFDAKLFVVLKSCDKLKPSQTEVYTVGFRCHLAISDLQSTIY
jgi:hypothetical protein